MITGWNWKDYIEECIKSVLAQTYKDFSVVIIDDGSDDGSFEIANKYGNIFAVETMTYNQGTFHARKFAIDVSIKAELDFDVVVFLDGDDLLLPNALEVVEKKYREENCLMTYGNWLNQDRIVCGMPLKYEKVIHENRDYRKDTFRCTHLRTFKKELYQKIKWWNPTKSEIESYPDVELLFQMMEMCGEKRIGVIYEPIYIYNETNPQRTLTRFGKDENGYKEICNRPKNNLL